MSQSVPVQRQRNKTVDLGFPEFENFHSSDFSHEAQFFSLSPQRLPFRHAPEIAFKPSNGQGRSAISYWYFITVAVFLATRLNNS